MSHLGSFGAAVRELDPDAEKDEFDFFDQKFTVYGTIPDMLGWQLASVVAGNGSRSSLRAALWSALYEALTKPAEKDGDPPDPSQFDRFYMLAIDKKASEKSLADLAYKLFEVQAGRPTEEPAGSSSGQSSTSQSSNGLSSTPPDSPGLRSVDEFLAG